ncbi:hypothetical protein ASE75_13290 [Sphingomonas sp. Leaf17]|uniref:hypothetical protein n=1 Tax=Sphingomonas sp. Leaf17 TaxID=1735683 RepID=UPI0006F8F91A|nr:hypothetical protein [Sphingomonas sp. Leaf17]KQM63414.1 hypothetical protein ASE75_13290 [Sphingomonas sp. Leaf17]
MRFIVDLYRYIVFAILAFLIIGCVFAGLEINELIGPQSPYMAFYVIGALTIAIGSIIGLGITATFISIHDRHVELVDEIRMWREEFYVPETVE